MLKLNEKKNIKIPHIPTLSQVAIASCWFWFSLVSANKCSRARRAAARRSLLFASKKSNLHQSDTTMCLGCAARGAHHLRTTCNTIMAMAVTVSMPRLMATSCRPPTHHMCQICHQPTHHRAPKFYQSRRKVLVMEGLHLKRDSKGSPVLASCTVLEDNPRARPAYSHCTCTYYTKKNKKHVGYSLQPPTSAAHIDERWLTAY